MVYLGPSGFQGLLGDIRYTCVKVDSNLKMAGRRAKWIEVIWDWGTVATYMLKVHFALESVQGPFEVTWCS